MRGTAAEGSKAGNLTADHVQSPLNDGEKIIEVVRDPSRELADGLHLLRLTERLFRLLARLVLCFQLARSLPDPFLQCVCERPQLCRRALSFGDIDIDAHYTDGATLGAIEDEAPRLHPFQRSVRSADDPELGLHPAGLRRETWARAMPYSIARSAARCSEMSIVSRRLSPGFGPRQRQLALRPAERIDAQLGDTGLSPEVRVERGLDAGLADAVAQQVALLAEPLQLRGRDLAHVAEHLGQQLLRRVRAQVVCLRSTPGNSLLCSSR